MVRWPMKSGRAALEEKKLSCFVLNQPKGVTSANKFLSIFLNNTKARKIVRTAGNVFFFFSPIVCDGVEGLSGIEQLTREALTGNLQSTS